MFGLPLFNTFKSKFESLLFFERLKFDGGIPHQKLLINLSIKLSNIEKSELLLLTFIIAMI